MRQSSPDCLERSMQKPTDLFTFGETVGHKKRFGQLLFKHLETAGLVGLTFPGHSLVQKVLLTDPDSSLAKY